MDPVSSRRLLDRTGHKGRLWAGVVVGVLLMALAQGVGAAADKVKISYPGPGMFFLNTRLAQQRGFFKEEGLEATLVITKSEIDRTALLSGDMDYTLRIGSPILMAMRGMPVRGIFFSTSRPFWAMVGRPGDKSVKDLKGRVLSVSGLAASEIFATKAMLKANGLDPEKDAIYTVVQLGMRLPALKSGAIGGGLMDYGEAFRSKQEGFPILLNVADHYQLATSGVGTTLKKLKEHPDEVKRFLRAHIKGLRYIRDQRAGTLEVMREWLNMDPVMAEEIFKLSVNNYTKDGTVDDKTLKFLLEVHRIESQLKEEVSSSQVLDFTPLKQALLELK